MHTPCHDLVDPKQVQLDEAIQKYKQEKGALIALLQRAQDIYGYLPQEVMERISKELKIPKSQVYGVVTFYAQFRLQPMGRNIIQVCMGTACHVRGGAKVLEAMEKELGIKDGKTTPDGRFSMEIVSCIGACGLSPVISVNGNVHGHLTPESVIKILEQYK